MWIGEIFCQVISEQEQFDENGDSLGVLPVNPHIVTATRHGLRCSDRTDAATADRPLVPGIESFYCSANTEAPFLAADADPAIGVIWYEEEVLDA